jgi:hypothetical protein
MSKKNVPSIISGAGFVASFIIALFKAVEKLGGSEDDVYAALKEGSPLVDDFATLIVKASKGTKDVFTLLVNYDRRVEAGVCAGHYDWSSSDITDKNFSTTQQGTKEAAVQLIHFNKTMSTDQVLAELDNMNLKPAGAQECLSFGEKYPDIQREFPIAFLGSVWQDLGGNRFCPCLGRSGSGRSLGLFWVGGDWIGICRFAAVSK